MKIVILITTLLFIHNTVGQCGDHPTLKIATYNTFLIPTNTRAPITAPKIIEEMIKSEIDIMCLQEIFEPSQALQFQQSLSSVYPYSFSEANTLEPNQEAHIACSADQINGLKSECITNTCATFFSTDVFQFIGCAALVCTSDILPVMDTECQSCLGAQQLSGNTNQLDEAIVSCSQNVAIHYNYTGGTMVLSKYPIVQQEIFTFPSNIVHRNILFVEVDVSALTKPKQGSDTLLFGCTHLVSTDGSGPYFPSSQMEIDLDIQSYEELNLWQARYILDTARVETENRLLSVMIAGDFNVGQMAFPQNFEIWQRAHFVPAQDLFHAPLTCTYCGDPTSGDNELAMEECETCEVPSADIDHILISSQFLRKGKDEGVKAVSYDRIFMDKFDINGEQLPLSDHWGRMLEVELFS